jgi:FSR family fosmidomycin resistance protein-like MFS transporter
MADVAAPTVLADVTDRLRPNAKLIALLALGHLVVDVTQGSLPAVLPFLKGAHGLSYAEAGTIVLTANVTSSIVQPVFGWLSDRTVRRWLLPLSVLTCGIGLGLTGAAPGYGALLLLVVVLGLGIAAYHPEGFKTATSVAGDRRATAVSWFALGGNLGIALGPPLITALIATFGLVGSLGMLVPTLVVATLLLAALPALSPASGDSRAARAPGRGVDMPRAMGLLIIVVTIRSWTQLGMTTFIPFYYVDELKTDARFVGTLLFVYLGAGALGTVIAGPLADRVGPVRYMRWALVGAAPLGALFVATSGTWVAWVMLPLFGAVLVSSFTISVVLGQAYLPRHAGMASGLIVGLAIGAGGLGVSVLGWIADHHGLATVLWISAILPVLGFVTALFLPRPREGA